MAFTTLIEPVKERLLDAYLFVRYFDFSDLEFLGISAPETN